jgi:hypothetical protein
MRSCMCSCMGELATAHQVAGLTPTVGLQQQWHLQLAARSAYLRVNSSSLVSPSSWLPLRPSSPLGANSTTAQAASAEGRKHRNKHPGLATGQLPHKSDKRGCCQQHRASKPGLTPL